jgi:hypothetical protein
MRARLGELKRDARDRMSLLVMVRSFLGCSGVGAALGGSWDLYQIFVRLGAVAV